MHAGVPGQELDDRVGNGFHRWGARRHVEVHIAARRAVGELHLEALADQSGEDGALDPASSAAPRGRFGEHQVFEGTANRPWRSTLATMSPPRWYATSIQLGVLRITASQRIPARSMPRSCSARAAAPPAVAATSAWEGVRPPMATASETMSGIESL